MINRILSLLLFLFFGIGIIYAEYSIYVDKNGVMRRNDTKEEVSFYGVNYTLPFAHSYRAMGYLGKDRKAEIDKDVYHISRMGANAYRIHVWDVEISDKDGNLIENDHLDLLDYLISELEKRNIRTLITFQTNFGNGYPEKNIITDGFSYHYSRDEIHSNPKAITAQQNYVTSLANHVNKYTGKSYNKDNYIVGFEINNEPYHSKSPKQTKEYINSMVNALRKTGCNKPLFYNASHNKGHESAYFNSNIQGVTYQWYPIGLVSGQMKKGNFLPYVDKYDMPHRNLKNYDKMAKIVYEFDPADILYSYMYPAIVRSFRSAGFQWITQFAYDPMAIAGKNTDYQTHYLNLVYTPSKAISMKIAAKVAAEIPRNANIPSYPQDTLFGNFRVSYDNDLSEYNTQKKFFYSNNTTTFPKNNLELDEIAGVGSSPIVNYSGSGAYFLDKVEDGIWRLEVMPDVIFISDPFTKPSLKNDVAKIAYLSNLMKLDIKNLGCYFSVIPLNDGNKYSTSSVNGKFSIMPGTYLIKRKDKNNVKINHEMELGNIKLNEYVAPKPDLNDIILIHQPAYSVHDNDSLKIKARVYSPQNLDSLIVYTNNVSFWNENNTSYKMKSEGNGWYVTTLPYNEALNNEFNYNIIVFTNGEKRTFPDNKPGMPLDYDFINNDFYKVKVISPNSPIVLFEASKNMDGLEIYSIPTENYPHFKFVEKSPLGQNYINIESPKKQDTTSLYIKKYIKEIVNNLPIKDYAIYLKADSIIGLEYIKLGVISSDGITYEAIAKKENNLYKVSLNDLIQVPTVIVPAPYPIFLNRFFTSEEKIPLKKENIEYLTISSSPYTQPMGINLYGAWIE